MFKKIFITILISLCLLPFFAMAADDDFVGPSQPKYTLLESLPSAGDGDLSSDVTLSEYLGWLFKFALVMAGFLAVLMITVGGIIYMASGGNESQITKAKERITNALWGLLLAFASYLLLYTINPQLVSFKFIDTLENYEVTSSNSENSGSGSSDSESEEEEWNSSRDTDYYDPDEEDFDFTDGDWDQYESNRNAEDPANTYTNEGASATNIEQENTDDEKREQFETSPEDAGLLQVN